MTMEFRVLGDIEVLLNGRLVQVGHARPRAVLAVLAAEANRVVTDDQLVDRVWGQARRPADPLAALRTYVWQVRQVLSGGEGVALLRQASGYKLVADRLHVDLHRYHDLLARARAAQDDELAAALICEALGLWRGEPFAGLDTAWVAAARHSLHLQRHAARVELTDRQLCSGRHAALLAELTDQVAEHPLDERITGQLMLALYRCGRQADALAQYRRIRRHLADEVGADPGPALHRLHQQILTADPVLSAPAGGLSTGQIRAVAVPRQLPAAPRLFTGREHELARLTKTLEEQAGSGAMLVISAIGGVGGIGKTWLALHWAHQHADRFPDGQLYVNLRGFDPSGQPMSPQTAVRGFLEALGVDPAAMPREPQAQVGLYRSLLADKRMLIVLDNARDGGQLAPLLPGSPTCTVLVTSRRQPAGLVSGHGAVPVNLDVLSEGEARDLLARHLGDDRLAAEPAAVAVLLRCCAGLPLALGIVAARALTCPGLPLAALAEELQDASARLDALDNGDLTANLRATLSWSYDALSREAARGLGLLALAPGPDIGLPAAASLLIRSATATRALLHELEHACLLHQHTAGRYRVHDLVRLYAADHAEHDHTPAERDAAVRRVVDFYTHTAHAAERLLDPHRRPIHLDAPASGVHVHRPLDMSAAMSWFQAEHPNLLAAQHSAVDHDWYATVWQVAWTLHTFHYRRAHPHDELTASRAALRAATHLADPATRSLAHRSLARAAVDLGRHDESAEHLRQALTIAEQHQAPTEQAHTYRMLARASARRGDYRRALDHATRAVDLYRTLNQPTWQARALNELGWYAARLGDYRSARTHCQTALTLHRRHHDPIGEANALDSLGYIEHHTSHHRRALTHYLQALALFHGLEDAYESASTLDALGYPYAALGRHRQAHTAWREALTLYRAQRRDTDATRVQQQLATLPAHPIPPDAHIR